MKWSKSQEELLIQHYSTSSIKKLIEIIGREEKSIYYKAFKLRLKKTQEYLDSEDACRLRKGSTRGKKTQFKKGHMPFNKGLKGWSAKGTEKTRFKKGSIPPNHKPVGSIRIIDGYQEIKVAEGMRCWKSLHRVVWERCNGQIPKGFNLIFRDGNKENIRLDNLELLSKSQNMKRNSYHTKYPKEIQLLIQLQGAINRQINKRTNHEQSQHA